jgi:hypothetical protein
MDPYRTLGVTRSCTREQVKEAFLARVPLAHPDHGGKDLAFIELRAAYEKIIAALDRRSRPRPDTDWRPPEPRDDGGQMPLNPTRTLSPAHRNAPHEEHSQKSADPTVAREAYFGWLQRVSVKAAKSGPSWQGKLIQTLGSIFILYLVFWFPAAGVVSVAMGILNINTESGLGGWEPVTVTVVWFVGTNIVSLLSAWLIMLIYDPR